MLETNLQSQQNGEEKSVEMIWSFVFLAQIQLAEFMAA